jgi:hypothetical protein
MALALTGVVGSAGMAAPKRLQQRIYRRQRDKYRVLPLVTLGRHPQLGVTLHLTVLLLDRCSG